MGPPRTKKVAREEEFFPPAVHYLEAASSNQHHAIRPSRYVAEGVPGQAFKKTPVFNAGIFLVSCYLICDFDGAGVLREEPALGRRRTGRNSAAKRRQQTHAATHWQDCGCKKSQISPRNFLALGLLDRCGSWVWPAPSGLAQEVLEPPEYFRAAAHLRMRPT